MASGDDGRATPEEGDGPWWSGADPADDPGPAGVDPGGADDGPGARGPRPVASQEPAGDDPDPRLPPLAPSSRQRRPRDPWIPDAPPLRTLSGPDIAGVVLLGALGVGVAVVLGVFVLSRFDARDPVGGPASPAASTTSAPGPVTPSAPAPDTGTPAGTSPATPATPTPSATPSATASAVTGPPGRIRGVPYAGSLEPVQVAGITASCTDDPTTDSSGGPLTWDADNAVDGDPDTAWRCAGRGVGERLTVRFDGPVTLGRIGILNGYGSSNGGRVRQDRRVLRARWTLDGNRWVEERPDTRDTDVQSFRIPPTTTTQVVIRIESTTSGARNRVAISELTFGAVAGN